VAGPALLVLAAVPAAARPAPTRVAQPVLSTTHVSAALSTLSAAPGDTVDVTLTMTVPPEGVPQSADVMTNALLSLKTDAGLWNFTGDCEVLSGPAPTSCSTSYFAQLSNWFGGGITQAVTIQLLFHSTVAPNAPVGAHNLLLRGVPGTLPMEEAEADGVFTVVDPNAAATKRRP
jgi:hypothetical protein